ncbi:heterokaryon incompatibility protein-domain-containing protein [Immersiella caudata]|uniref:Heterokaryon incompatibility protein-domain-containing protein n=1 Tax=Immersiella caudata TaxID=314043 RepID=A0AA39WJZ8_9PEZI|nr:heterokaryon incompatibility protein-domain-containing protein [Immersiella caudata]
MRAWFRKKIDGRQESQAANSKRRELKRQADAQLRYYQSLAEKGRCEQCFDVDPQQWFSPPQPGSASAQKVFSWDAEKCFASCEIGSFIRNSTPDAVTFQSWLLAAKVPVNRHNWVSRDRCGAHDDCFLCGSWVERAWFPAIDGNLLDPLNSGPVTVKTIELGGRRIPQFSEEVQVDLRQLRYSHAPQWMKTVDVTVVNNGGWSSVRLMHATSEGISEPVRPGGIPTKFQRVLIPTGGKVSDRAQGRQLDRRYDPEIVKLWHRTCSEKHSALCHRDAGGRTPFPVSLKLIDVHRWCIVVLPAGEEPEYAALSYVWGPSQQPSLATDTLQLWSAKGALREHVSLPQTIQDAIQVTQDIGMRFLWVDALCIVQDAEREKALQIRQMDRIYSRASLTLAATAGYCRIGLPGVSVPWRHTHQPDAEGNGKYEPHETHQLSQCKVGNTSLMEIMENPDAWLRDSIWRQRGWTFQEELCSNRVVYFLENNLLFTCGEATWRADVALEHLPSAVAPEYQDDHRQRIRGLTCQPDSMDRQELIGLFRKLVHGYMLRTLTRDDDIENAFSGVANALCGLLGPLYHGIPERIFGEVIEGCWCWDLILDRRQGFPSWSWTGWRRALLPETGKVKDPEIGISPARAQTASGPLLKFFRLSRYGATPQPLFDRTVVSHSENSFLNDHFRPDADEINKGLKKVLAQAQQAPKNSSTDYIAFFTSIAFLSITPLSHFWEAQATYSVHKKGASQKRLTTIRLPSDPYRRQIQGSHAFIVTSRGEKGFQLMMVEFVDGIAYKINATAPGEPVKGEDWIGVGAARSLVIMG